MVVLVSITLSIGIRKPFGDGTSFLRATIHLARGSKSEMRDSLAIEMPRVKNCRIGLLGVQDVGRISSLGFLGGRHEPGG